MDMPLYPGDPLTPGVGATANAKRLGIKDAKTLTKIPVLPISYGDALPLLKNMDGAVVPDDWRGALPVTYHFGGGTPTVHMKLAFNWDTKTLYDVVAKMRGAECDPFEIFLRSVPQMPQVCTRTRISPCPIAGTGTSSRRTSF